MTSPKRTEGENANQTGRLAQVQLGMSILVMLASVGWVYINRKESVDPFFDTGIRMARISPNLLTSRFKAPSTSFPTFPARCATSGNAFQPSVQYKMNCTVGWPGVFHDYVFATEVGCVGPNTRSIHGLWPNYFNRSDTGGYNWPQFCGTEKLKLEELKTVPGLVERLHLVWKSCPPHHGDKTQDELDFEFWSHEWFRHGSCSGYSQAEYFTTVVNLFDEMLPWLNKACDPNKESCDVNVSHDRTAAVSHDQVLGAQCQPGESCWPSAQEIATLRALLNASSSRNLNWEGYPQGQPCSVPLSSKDSQSLYGLGNNCTDINALYVNKDLGSKCYSESNSTEYNKAKEHCKAATRNQPYEGWTPAFVAFCENAGQVRVALEFALKHRLCVMVASTGHEYLNRHSCPTGGIMIRTSAMKGAEFIEEWKKNPAEAPHGAFRFGVGLTFSEAHKFAAESKRVISSGWCNTVGLIGWSLGGGHGPLAPSLGLGVDNTLEFTVMVVSKDVEGQKVVEELVVNATSNPSLFWAMKGGGGSAWGIVTSIVVRAHPIPVGGFTQMNISTHGSFCEDKSKGEHNFAWLRQMWRNYADWQLTLDKKFSVQTSVWPKAEKHGNNCNGTWNVIVTYIYNGAKEEPAQAEAHSALVKLMDPQSNDSNDLTTLPTFYQEVTQYPGSHFAIRPNPAKPTSLTNTGAQSSVLVSREKMKNWAEVFGEILEWCPKHGQCDFHFLYLAFTGNLGSPQAKNTALSPGMRSYMMAHNARNLSLKQLDSTLYTLGNYSYFSESAYVMENWGNRYWGENYDLLQEVKRRYDPFHIFRCHHCIGDDATI